MSQHGEAAFVDLVVQHSSAAVQPESDSESESSRMAEKKTGVIEHIQLDHDDHFLSSGVPAGLSGLLTACVFVDFLL